jgi:hypothetical protein
MDSDIKSLGLLDYGFQAPRALGARDLDAIVGAVGETLLGRREVV